MQKEFRPLLDSVAAVCQDYFGPRLIAGYLHGSILYGDAIPGVSDLDYMLVLTDLSEADKSWLRDTAHTLELQHSVAAEVHLSPCTLDDLRAQSFARFALTYNAGLHLGQDPLAMLAAEGETVPAPDTAFAKSRLEFARHCFQQALRNETPDCTGPLPNEPCYILRKFARYFVVIEGAYYLMSKGQFESFRPQSVLSALTERFPSHVETLILTNTILDAPTNQSLSPSEYLLRIEPLVMEMFDKIANA